MKTARKRAQDAPKGSSRHNGPLEPFGTPQGQKNAKGRVFLLVAGDRVPWRSVGGRSVTRARWECILAFNDPLEAAAAPVPEWADESSIVHASALSAETIARYEREAAAYHARYRNF